MQTHCAEKQRGSGSGGGCRTGDAGGSAPLPRHGQVERPARWLELGTRETNTFIA